MDDFPAFSDLLGDARHDFKEYYATASVADARLMDGLVMTHAALVVAMNTPREGLSAEDRRKLEQVAMQAEQEFTRFRVGVQASPTYQRVSEGERWAIETTLCQVTVPEL